MKALTRIITAVAALAALAATLTLGRGVLTQAHEGELHMNAAEATITVDGDNADWAAITGLTVTLMQIEIPPGVDWDAPGVVTPIDATVKVATDDSKIYVLFEVPDDYDFNPTDHNFSASPNVMFLIDPAAGPHMGADDPDYETGLGMVDLWHWELDCAAGVMSGGGDAGSGNDPDCNLDDEYSTDPETREDDGGGDPNAAAENSIAGVWSHTNATIGGAGTWIFEMSRPLQTGDPEDAQFAAGGIAKMALAYFDADEGLTGWTDTGHLVSSHSGWIITRLPGVAEEGDISYLGTQVATVLAAIDIADTSGFHGLQTDMEAATEINSRWAGTVNKALQAVSVAAWPPELASAAATVKADLEAAAAALAADDLAAATAAVTLVHGSAHGLSNDTYAWLALQAGKLAGTERVWGDSDCSGAVNPVDSLKTLRHDAGLSVAQSAGCPPVASNVTVGGTSRLWNDVDCSGAVNPIDSLKTLRHDAGLSVAQEAGCPGVGTSVTVAD